MNFQEDQQVTGADQTLDHYSSNPTVFAQESRLDTLEVHEQGASSSHSQEPRAPDFRSVPFSRRKAIIVSSVITGVILLFTGGAALLLTRLDSNGGDKASLEVTSEVSLKSGESFGVPKELQGAEESLVVKGDVITRGSLKISNGSEVMVLRADGLTGNRTFNLPDVSGTLCVDTNNCNFATAAQLAQLTNQLGQIVVPDAPPSVTLNNLEGDIVLQGTVNRVSVTTTGGVITLSTPQDIASTSSPTFAGAVLNGNVNIGGTLTLPLNCTTFLNGGSLTTNASGQVICTDDETSSGGTSVTTPGGVTGTIPVFIANDAIDDSIISQALGTITVSGGLSVTGSISGASLTLTSALTVPNGGTGSTTFTANGVLIGNGAGALSATAAPANGQVLLGNGAVPTFTTISGDIVLAGTGVTTIQANSVALGVDTTGDYVAGLTAGNGLSVAGSGGEGSSPSVSLSLQANKGLEVDVNGLSLIDCASDGFILKYSTGTGTWGCAADSGSGGLGDDVSVNSSNATGANFINTAATGTIAATTWSLDTLASPDNVSIAIGAASGTDAGILTAGVQTLGGAKTFNGLITAGAGVSLGTQTLQGTTAVIDFNNFDVSGTGAVTAVGVNAGSGLIQGTGGITVAGTVTLSSLTNGFLEVNGTGVVSVGTIDLGADTAGNYVATITSGNGVSAAATGEGSTPTVALANLTADWLQSGAFDIVLNDSASELKILESGLTPTFYAILDVSDLAADQTFTLSQGGTVVTTGNVATHATTGVTAGGGLTGGGTVGILTLGIGAGNGVTVNANDITLALQANKGLEVDVNGLSLIDCASGEVLKYNGTNQWACAADAAGAGDSITVNSTAATDANFLNTAATGTSTATTWSLNAVSNPDDVTIAIGNASATEAGAVTTGAQTLAGIKTFNSQIAAAGGISLGAQTLAGTTGVIDFTNFDVSGAGAVVAVGVNSGTGLLQGTGGLTVGGTITLSSLASGFLEVNGTGVVSVGTIDLGADTVGNYVATLTSGNGVSAAATGEGSTPTIALADLTANWLQGGAFDIVLNNASSELSILESAGGLFYGNLDVGDLTASRTYTFPDATGTVCLTTGNCSGSGGGVTTPGGTTNRVAKFTGSQTIGDSTITDDGTNVSITGDFTLQGGDAVFGTSAVAGTLITADTAIASTNSQGLTIRTGNATGLTSNSGSLTLDVGTATGTAGTISIGTSNQTGVTVGRLANGVNFTLQGGFGSTLKATDGTNTTTFGFVDPTANATINVPALAAGTYDICTTSGNCVGGGGGGAPNGAAYLTIGNDATLTNERAIAVNTTNLSVTDGGANGSYTINTIQDIATTSSPSFTGVTATGSGPSIIASGAPAASATSSLIRVGNAIAGGNSVVDGGTYIGLNAPSTGAGSAADFINLQQNGVSKFLVANTGNVTAGTYNGQTISSTASLTGTVTVAGLTTLNGGLTVEAGDTFTFNGDGFTDLTGNGLQISTGSLNVKVLTAADALSSTTSSGSGLEVLSAGLGLLQGCADGEILKWNETSDTWGCAADAGSGGVGDSITVNSTAATDANFLNTAATGTSAATTWSINTVSSPDDITIAIGNASATEAGAVTTGAQTFAGAKTFNGQIIAGAGIDLAAQTLQGTTAVINFDNFDVDASGNITTAGDAIINGSDITTTSAATSAALILQPGISTAATGTGAAVTVKGGNQSGTTTSTGGALTLQGGNATGAAGTRTGGDVSIDAGTGASANGSILIGSNVNGNISIGSALTTGTITIGGTAQTGAINIGTGAGVQNVNLGTGTTRKNVVIGATGVNGSTIIHAMEGGLSLGNDGASNTIQIGNTTGAVGQTINIGNNATALSSSTILLGSTIGGSTTTIQSGTGGININSTGASIINIGTTGSARTVNLGTAATAVQTVNVGSTNTSSSLLLQAGTGGLNIETQGSTALNIGNNAVAQTLNIGNTTGATALNLRAGTGNFSLNGVAGTTYSIGAATTTGTISIGGTTQSGSITVDTGTGTGFVNIGTGAGNKSIVIGALAGTPTQSIFVGANTGAGSTTTVTVGSTIGTSSLALQAGTGNITIGGSASARTVNIANAAAAQTVTLGSTNGASSLTLQGGTGGVNLGTGGVANTIQIGNTTGAVAQTINLGTNGTATSTTNVNIGSAIGTSNTSITAGATGTISIGASGTNSTILIGNPAAATTSVTLGSTVTTSTTTLQSGSGGIVIPAALAGTVNTSTYLCRNSINQLTTCLTTGTGAAFVQGGNSFTATAILGTNDANDLQFETSGTTKLTVLAGGNVGIGITAPTSLLHVVGSQPADVATSGTAATQALQVTGGKGGNTTGTTGQVGGAGAAANITGGAGGNAPSGSTNGNGGSITLQGGAPGSGLGSAGSYGNILLQSSGGNVGINDSTPEYSLDVGGTGLVARFGGDPGVIAVGTIGVAETNAFLGGYHDAGGSSTIYFGQNLYWNGAWTEPDAGALTSILVQQSGAFNFYTGTNGLGTQKLIIENDGDVAIGPTTATAGLDVQLSRTTPVANLENTNSAGTGNGLRVNVNSESGTDNYLLNVIGNGSTALYVREGGNVGIGDASPAYKLTVGNGDLFGVQGADGSLIWEGSVSDVNQTVLTVVNPTADVTYRLADATAGTYDICTTANNCAGVAGSTLQQTYGLDADGSDAIIALTAADDSLIFRNPSSAGTDSGYVLSVDQLNTGAVDGLRINNAGTGDILKLQDGGTTVARFADGGHLLAANAATATTGTTEAVARTNVTAITLTTDAFSVNDVIFFNNAGQDYYARVTVDNANGTYTVSPAVSYDASITVTKYTIQNIGATDTDYTTQTNRFFQGYFLGGVVTGAGSTTLSDGNLSSTGNLVLQGAGGNVGIGTSTPGAVLDVNGTGSAVARFGSTSGNQISIGTADAANGAWIRNDGTNTVFSTNVGDLYLGLGGNSGKIIRLGNSAGVLQITGNAPDASVTINGSGYLGANYANLNSPSQRGRFDINGIGGTNTGLFISAGSTSANYAIQVNNEANTTSYLSVRGDGNVGIGNASPAALLTVGSGSLFQVSSAGLVTYANGTADSNTLVCRTSGGQLAACTSAALTGTAFIQGGNSFAAAGRLGTNDANNLEFETADTVRLTLDQSNVAYFGNGVTSATPSGFTLQGTGSSTAGTAGAGLTVSGGAGATATTGSAGGSLTLLGGNAGGTGANDGGDVFLAGGTATGAGVRGDVILQQSGGNVGIGDASPAYLLTVGSNDSFGVNSSGNVVFNDTAHTVSVLAETTANAVGNSLTITAGAANGSTTGAVGGLLALSAGDAAGSGNNDGGEVTINGGAKTGTGNVGSISLQSNGTGGSVRIGNSTFGGRFTVSTGSASTTGMQIRAVASQTAAYLKLSDNSARTLVDFTPIGAADQRVQFNLYNTFEATPTNYERLAQYADNPNSVFRIETQNGGTGTLRNLTLQGGGGNVGIGSTAPQSKLEVVGNIISSGTEWTTRTSAADNSWESIAYGNGTFVAVSVSGIGNRVMTSPDGINWVTRTSAADNDWYAVTYGNGLFVAVAGTGTGNRVMTSPDGITWTSRTSAADNTWLGVTYGNGLFVAVSNSGVGNRVMTSPDGITWTSRTSAADNGWNEVTYGNGIFVATANSGTGNRVMTSPDGITWTARTSAADNNWNAITYGNGLFVAVAFNSVGNQVMTSPDGITWTARTAPIDSFWNSVSYGNGLFVAVSSSGTGNRVMTSPDGINWKLRTNSTNNDWKALTYGNGSFVAVANTGTGTRAMTSGIQGTNAVPTNNIYQGGFSLNSGDLLVSNGVLKVATTANPTLSSAKLLVTIAEVTTALRVGDGTNGVSFNDGVATKLRLRGTARNDVAVSLEPEFSGMTLTGSGTGTMTALFCSDVLNLNDGGGANACGTNEEKNYYEWTTAEATAQSYGMYIRYKLPSDFDGFLDSSTIKLTAKTSDTTDSTVTLAVYRNNTQCGSTTTINSSNDTWQTTSLTGDETGCSFAAGDTMTVRILTTAGQNDKVRVGNLEFVYKSVY